MELQEILTIIDHVAQADTLSEVEIDDHGYRISVKTDRYRTESGRTADRQAGKEGPAVFSETHQPASPAALGQTAAEEPAVSPQMTVQSLQPQYENTRAAASESGKEYVVTSPLVGTFYAAPEEGKEPYVKAGDRVTKGQVLGIVEAMKLMNEIECEYDGIVEAVLIQNEQVVEYGQPLFRILGDEKKA